MQLKSKYCTILYNNADLVNKASDRLKVKGCNTIAQKIDKLTERVQKLLSATNTNLHFNIEIFKNVDDVESKWLAFYGTEKRVSAFYSKSRNTVYVAANKIRNRIMAHEISHVILTKHFVPFMTGEVQEVICQWIEKKL